MEHLLPTTLTISFNLDWLAAANTISLLEMTNAFFPYAGLGLGASLNAFFRFSTIFIQIEEVAWDSWLARKRVFWSALAPAEGSALWQPVITIFQPAKARAMDTTNFNAGISVGYYDDAMVT